MGVTIKNLRLPDDIESGAVCFPSGWRTTKVVGANGLPHHNAEWSYPISRYEFETGNHLWQWGHIQKIINMHLICKGSAYGFLFRDPSDWEAYTGEGQVIDVGGTLYLGRVYAEQSESFIRPCKRIISGTATIDGGGSIDYATGIVTGVPEGTAATFQFLKAVAFDQDELPVALTRITEGDRDQNIASITISLIEIPEF